MNGKSSQNSNSLTLDEEFLKLAQSTIRRQPVPAFLTYLVIGGCAYNSVNTWLIFGWLSLSAFTLFGRAIYIFRDAKNPLKSVKQKVKAIYFLNACNGVILSLSLFFFPHMSITGRALQTLLLVSLASGTASTTGGNMKAYLPYSVLVCVPIAVVWFVFPVESDRWISYGTGLLALAFLYNLTAMGRDTYHSFKTSVEMRQRYIDINLQLEKALAESELSSAAKTRFLATASHDLRQPVHTLSLLTAALRARELDERTDEISRSMDQSLQTLSNQLNALLDISKLDAGIISPKKDSFNLAYSLKRISDQQQSNAAQKGIKIELKAQEQLFALTDGNLIESIFQNLVSNAIKYTQKGHIVISLKREKNLAVIRIRDTGIGIPMDKQELVFEEFYQIDNPHRDKMKGLGLGLSIVRRLNKLLDIEMTMHSEEGIGTEFVLKLPLCQSSSETSVANDEHAYNFARLRVLVVDDEEGVRVATRIYLEELGCSVMLAESSEQARTLAELNPPDLLLTDFRLKDNDSGLITIKLIRQLYSDIPVIIMTGDTAPDRLKEAHAADAKLLHKPIEIETLKKAMQSCLAKSPHLEKV